MRPSEVLSRAADLIRDTGKKAGSEHDCQRESCGGFADYRGHCGGCCSCMSRCLYEDPDVVDGSWLDLTRPAVAPHIEAWLRAAAEAAVDYEYWLVIPPWIKAAGEFAMSVLGVQEEARDVV